MTCLILEFHEIQCFFSFYWIFGISGEIVKDFQIRLTVKENRPITGLNVHIPVIGELSNDLVEYTDRNTARIVFNMSEVEQVLCKLLNIITVITLKIIIEKHMLTSKLEHLYCVI